MESHFYFFIIRSINICISCRCLAFFALIVRKPRSLPLKGFICRICDGLGLFFWILNPKTKDHNVYIKNFEDKTWLLEWKKKGAAPGI